ncbi:hypothetical protein BRPE64_CCDS05320 [Caballeronia insecticola]|uniref:Uncharacterized protein n=1 Tax=Caballeronia insecticola TaxID=758793 RepID=R4WYL8_9BURK|nr:hypothetical protein BRPE64_CCDS05320 [Caballeronia insecticola]
MSDYLGRQRDATFPGIALPWHCNHHWHDCIPNRQFEMLERRALEDA